MADIIPFLKPKIKLTTEETEEYKKIQKEIQNIKGLRDLILCRRKVKEFLKKVEERSQRRI